MHILLAALCCGSAWGFQPPETPALAGGHVFNGTVEVAFAPWDDGEALIQRALAEARHEIYVQIFMFTSRNVANALIAAQQRGVRVQVLADGQNVAGMEASQIPRLAQAGIPVALETRYASAHNKVMVIDPEQAGCAVLTGSYNYTRSARTRNAENLLLLKGDANLARAYLANWRRHRAEATPYSRSVLKEIPPRSSAAPVQPRGERLPFPWEGGRPQGREALEFE